MGREDLNQLPVVHDGRLNGIISRSPYFIVVDNQRSDDYDWVSEPVFDSSYKQVAFVAKKNNEFWWKLINLK